MIKESIANYPGKCPCPYSIMSTVKNVEKEVYSNLADMNHCVIFRYKNNSDKAKGGSLKIVTVTLFILEK